MIFKTFRIGGVNLDGNKLTDKVATVQADLPSQAVFPLSQHFGTPAKPVVKKNDHVKVGSLIAEADGMLSANIHSSVSGIVHEVHTVVDSSGCRKPAIIINVEGDEWEEYIDRTSKLELLEHHPELTAEEIIIRIKDAGVTAMDETGMPTYSTLTSPDSAKTECIILNGAECEPYATADYRLMMEHADEILVGLDLLMKATDVEHGYVGIEVDKPSAIALLRKKTANRNDVEIVSLKQKYPQGGYKQLVEAVTGRQVSASVAMPVSGEAKVYNVATAFAVYEAVMKHKPLFERYTTVTGKEMAHPGNFLVRMGTPVGQLIDACGGMPVSDNKVIMGTPMTGCAIKELSSPIVKDSNCITILSGREAYQHKPSPCLRCAKCVDACPMGLEPYLLATLSDLKMWNKAERECITSCMECGSCQFVCPAYRRLLDSIRIGKQMVAEIIK